MKNAIIIIVFALKVLVIYAQCNCSGSSSNISLSDNGTAMLTLPKNKWIVETFADYRTFKQTISHHHHIHSANSAKTNPELKAVYSAIAGIRYGLTNNITVSLQQPYVWLNAKPESESGIADLMFNISFQVFKKNNFSMAFIIGTEFPTGKKSKLPGESNLAIGTGSFDPLSGFLVVKAWNKSFLRTGFFYKYTTKGYNQINYGSFMSHVTTFGYKFVGESACNVDSVSRDKLALHALLSVAGESVGVQKQNKTTIVNTGGYSLFAAAGTQISFNKWSIPVSINIPVMQMLNGEQSITRYRVKIGLIKMF